MASALRVAALPGKALPGGNVDYRQAAKTVLEYMLATLFDESVGLFFGSQDADEEYYSRDIQGRSRLEQPPVDKTFYTDSNARAISALAVASAVLEDKELLAIAGRAADSLWAKGFREGAGLCHYLEPADMSPHLWGQLGDQVLMIAALSSLYQAKGERVHLERAEILAKVLVEQYLDERGWLAEPAWKVAEGKLPTGVDLPGIPVAELDIISNGLGARVLLDLETLSPTRGFGEAAKGIVESLSERYRGYVHFASQYAMATERLLKGPVEVSIDPGLGEEEHLEALRRAAMLFNSRKVVNPHPSPMLLGGECETSV